jgi:hypothetical protein
MPDNVDVTRLGRNTTGFNFTRQDAINFITWLADAAHKKGMGMGLKNVKGESADCRARKSMQAATSAGQAADGVRSGADKHVCATCYLG